MIKIRLIFYCFTFIIVLSGKGQVTLSGDKIVDEFYRRKFISNMDEGKVNFMLRSVFIPSEFGFYKYDSLSNDKSKNNFKFYPLFLSPRLDHIRPYVGGEKGMIPARGLQSFFSTGFHFRFSIFHFQLQPEFVFAQNLPFQGLREDFSLNYISSRFLYWNVGDSPERFGNSIYSKFYWGQSSIGARYGAFEIALGTKNFWWGPGQWNSLIFSNNAPGFPHISLNTTKPAITFLGSFEGQLLIGRLESSKQEPTQFEILNNKFFRPLNPDWRYLNGMMVSFTPKFFPSLTLGHTRTFQYYNSERPNDFFGWLPIFEPMAKENFFLNGNSVVYDDRNQSQQISIFGKYNFLQSKAEVYFEFGRRDHAFNWREFFLNPEHARAYQFGFLKMYSLPISNVFLQLRGEITHQQESVNRILRYGKQGGIAWHTHGHLRGFTNFGQPMGVGIGTGSNVQTLEVSLVEDWNKWGVLFERLENNQDFYYRAFGQQGERKPWVDWSTALLWNTSYKDLFISARLQGTYARNYQWGISENSTAEFPVSENLFSVHSQVNLIYFWNRSLKKEKSE